jgi:hypothetical protein
MMGMPVRRPRKSLSQSQQPETFVLRLPLSDAEAQLDARIAAGRELADKVDTEVVELEAPLATTAARDPLNLFSDTGGEPPGKRAADALSRRASQWRDYNRAWLVRNLGGEAAEEYDSASTHRGFGRLNEPMVNLRHLREGVESEISKLESIRERLPMWQPPDAAAPTSAAIGPQTDGGGPPHVRCESQVRYGHLWP